MGNAAIQAGKRATYPAYKPSGVVWLGHVPEHWEVKRAKGLLARNDGGVWGEDFDDDGVIVLRSTEQTVDGEWKIVEPAKRRLTSTEYGSCRLKEGDLVVTKSSGSSLHIGKTSIVTKEVEALNCCYSNFMQRLRVKRTAEPRFVWYVLNGELGRKQFDYYSSTTTGLANLNGSIIGNVGMAVPPLAEQKAIAAFLDRETARIDALIEKKRRQIELLQEKRSALISHAVTKGLDPNAPMKPSGIEWLGDVPDSWHHRKLGYVASMSGGCTPSKSNEAYWRGTIPWVSPKDMKKRCINDSEDHVSEEAVSDTGLRLLEPPVVLIVVRGMILAHTFPVGLTTAPVTINQDMKALRPERGVVADYLAFLLEGISSLVLSHVDESAHGTKCLRTDLWKNISVFIPDEQEQLEICEQLHDQMRKIDDLIRRVEESAATLREHRSALISAAVTGKIDVRGEVA